MSAGEENSRPASVRKISFSSLPSLSSRDLAFSSSESTTTIAVSFIAITEVSPVPKTFIRVFRLSIWVASRGTEEAMRESLRASISFFVISLSDFFLRPWPLKMFSDVSNGVPQNGQPLYLSSGNVPSGMKCPQGRMVPIISITVALTGA